MHVKNEWSEEAKFGQMGRKVLARCLNCLVYDSMLFGVIFLGAAWMKKHASAGPSCLVNVQRFGTWAAWSTPIACFFMKLGCIKSR